VVCGTFASGGAQCHVIRSIKPIVAEYTSYILPSAPSG
jgi:hypothetical protein